ncbi:Hypothetical predicted protein [Podarcis lilfordi]|uniref:Uncharacterized protein n=1 Tax=Podarcis lilfordi TaxID=74358 RepID=A0AA35KQE3_9SAUR|nr:Hypothetical predicted protein [Podarcis lilfordi]
MCDSNLHNNLVRCLLKPSGAGQQLHLPPHLLSTPPTPRPCSSSGLIDRPSVVGRCAALKEYDSMISVSWLLADLQKEQRYAVKLDFRFLQNICTWSCHAKTPERLPTKPRCSMK